MGSNYLLHEWTPVELPCSVGSALFSFTACWLWAWIYRFVIGVAVGGQDNSFLLCCMLAWLSYLCVCARWGGHMFFHTWTKRRPKLVGLALWVLAWDTFDYAWVLTLILIGLFLLLHGPATGSWDHSLLTTCWNAPDCTRKSVFHAAAVFQSSAVRTELPIFVSSAKLLITTSILLMQIMKSTGPRPEPWETLLVTGTHSWVESVDYHSLLAVAHPIINPLVYLTVNT